LKADIDRLIRSSQKMANAELKEWADQVIQGVERVSTHARTGIPAREIVLLANEQAVDLIVMGTRGSSGLKHILLGSVTENVIKTAKTPVLVVRSAPTTSNVGYKTNN
jgi:nucleotide-binding universal stress UspA family protein